MVNYVPRLTRGEKNFLRFTRSGFSNEEANFYAQRKIGGRNVQWLIRARKRFMAKLTPKERAIFIEQMDDLYGNLKTLGEEEGDMIYSPELYDEMTGISGREEMIRLWKEQLGKTRIRVK